MKERPILFSGPMVRADKPVNDGDYPAVYVQTNDGWIIQELAASLDLLLTQTRRGVSLPDNPDRLCAIDNQTIERAEKALANAKKVAA